MYRIFKKSFSLIELCLYIVAVGAIISTISRGIKVIENTRTQRAIEEIEYYNKANSEFVIRYGALPGLLTKEKCKSFIDFMNYCVKDGTINATTNENLFNDEKCDKDLGCLITKNGSFGTEDVITNFLTPMRYLKQAGLIDTINYNLKTKINCPDSEDTHCDRTQYSKRVWAKSRIANHVYVNIYNYYNKDKLTDVPFLFSGQKLMGHIINSGQAYDNYGKLVKSKGQYLIYHTFSSSQKEVANVNIVDKIDKKIDDGKPLTGRLTTYSTSDFSNFNASSYARCITLDPKNKDAIEKATYNTTGNSGECSFIYLLDDMYDFIKEPILDASNMQ